MEENPKMEEAEYLESTYEDDTADHDTYSCTWLKCYTCGAAKATKLQDTTQKILRDDDVRYWEDMARQWAAKDDMAQEGTCSCPEMLPGITWCTCGMEEAKDLTDISEDKAESKYEDEEEDEAETKETTLDSDAIDSGTELPSLREELTSPRENPPSPREEVSSPREEPSSPREESSSLREEPPIPREKASILREKPPSPRRELPKEMPGAAQATEGAALP